jgi:hypothetical protein
MRRFPLFLLMAALFLAACAETAEPPAQTATAVPDDGFDRRAMLENMTRQVILPAHEELVERLADLETAVVLFTDDPNLETLTAVREAWLAANLARMALLPFRIGPVDDSLLHNRMDNRPPRVKFIDETVIAGTEPITGDYLASIGSSSVGLGAMEYLLFDPVGGDTAVLQSFTTAENSERRRQLLQGLAANLHQRGRELAQIWQPDGENYAGAFIEADMDGGELQGSMNMLVNQMIADVEEIVASRLGKPSGQRSNGVVRPDLVEAAYSGASLPRIIATVMGVQLAFNGGDGLGFDDYLDYLGATYEGEPLSAAINGQFEATLAALGEIEGSLETAVETDLAQVETAVEETRALLVLLKVDTTNHLGVTLTFNDNDGD